MRPVILALLLMFSGSASAEWVRVAWTSGAITYIDDASIEKSGNTRRFRMVVDLKEPHERGFHSLLNLNEVDCAARRVRAIEAVAFSGKMGTGKQVMRSGQSDWFTVPAGSGAELQLKFACDR